MKFAFIVFDKMTSLDFISAFDPLTRLKSMNFVADLQWDICMNHYSGINLSRNSSVWLAISRQLSAISSLLTADC